MSDSPDPLDELLKTYPSPPPLAADFKAQVQQRIARSIPPHRHGWWANLNTTFAQPAFAVVFVFACTLLGLLLAEIRTSAERSRTHARVVDSYLQLINPRIEPDALTTPPPRRDQPEDAR
ncbi:hypothetical protein [Synoicihabitans lomoniglobus]|uniref:Transmembrane protein n=1 Tax=Synoicihabitans lomoniglobus TaxID=2909285 RepID=A0AAE9ZV11_9BACT|nr:hypothetical protein [Opitutaceae bacterium LMO-M01]WED63609.1 hypothetical protein PXH66_14830 [Opitutaceae bacterium LMO-M01]